MSCAAGVPLDRLVAYWLGDTTSVALDVELEEHQWACDDCTRRLAWLASLGDATRALVRRRGGLALPLTGALVDRLAADGVRLRHYRPARNQDVACAVALDDDLVASWLDADPADDERIDVELRGPDGALWQRYEDIPVDRAVGKVVLAEAGDRIRLLPTITIDVVVTAVGPRGARLVSRHAYHHTAAG